MELAALAAEVLLERFGDSHVLTREARLAHSEALAAAQRRDEARALFEAAVEASDEGVPWRLREVAERRLAAVTSTADRPQR